MNAPSPESSPEVLTPWLLAYDLAVGSVENTETVPLDLRERVEQVKSCLRLLDTVWPPSRPRSPTRGGEGPGATTPDDRAPAPRSTPLIRVAGFDILHEIARGGMGVVYKARQQSLDRIVAIKCLPPIFAQDPNRLARFRREALAAAKLVNTGILPIYDVLEADGVPLLVMPYIDGSDLARIIADRLAVRQGKPRQACHPWASLDTADYLAHILPVLDRAVEALALLHQAEVIHRDIKPSNILVDRAGHAWLTDFGLARLGAQSGLTIAGQGLGTPGFMSPEQWDGGPDVDGRTDVFSMGVTMYQALTSALPYGSGRLTAATRLPAPPSHYEAQLPAGIDDVLLRAMAPDLRDRYQSAAEFHQEWGRVRAGLPPRRKAPGALRRALRPRHRIVAGAMTLVLGFLLLWRLTWGGPPQSQDQPAPPAVRTVTIATDPPGADMVFVPLDRLYGEPDPENAVWAKTTAASPAKVQLPPGTYFVEAQLPNGRFHQVYRYVPKPDESMGRQPEKYLAVYPQERWSDLPDDGVGLPTIRIPPADVAKGMVKLAGGNFMLGTTIRSFAQGSSYPAHNVFIPPYSLDKYEVTEGQYRNRGALPSNLYQPRGDDFPVTQVTFREAAAWAEHAGKRIPTEAEYEYAATNGGTTTYPWGSAADRIREWPLGHKGEPAWDRTQAGIYGLYSNVAEWTSTWRMDYPGNDPTAPNVDASTTRVFRGGPYSVVKGSSLVTPECRLGPRLRVHLPVNIAEPGLGFRCARCLEPIFLHRPHPAP